MGRGNMGREYMGREIIVPRNIFFVLLAIAFAVLFLGASQDDTASPATDSPKEVTYNRDVAPIFYKNCVMCHRPNDIAPMSLLTYKDARTWGRAIREAVVQRKMPPWHA